MQQVRIRQWKKLRMAVLTIIWVAGLLMAGSDGLFMPWLNGIGLVLFFLSSWFLGNGLQNHQHRIGKSFVQASHGKMAIPETATGKGRRVSVRYALES